MPMCTRRAKPCRFRNAMRSYHLRTQAEAKLSYSVDSIPAA